MSKFRQLTFMVIFATAICFINVGVMAQASQSEDADRSMKDRIKSEIMEELQEREGILAKLAEHFSLGLLIEFGGVYEDVEFKDGRSESRSSLALATVELALGVRLNDWVNGEVIFLFEDPPFEEESGVDLDVGTITIGNPEKFPLTLTGGALYVPFGALYTHFPDDPLLDLPLTLSLGETREKALVASVEFEGLSLSAYAFNGDMDEQGSDDHIKSFGADANYTWGDAEKGLPVFTLGVSYISNIADADGVTDALEVESLKEYVGGFDAYLHVDFAGFFVLGEYMTAVDEFDPTELADENGDGAQPEVWNIEAGYNWNWGKNLEIALKYAGSDQAGGLGFPESRYGINFNQELFDGVVLSLGYIHDRYHDNDADERDERDIVFSQIAVEL